MRDSKDREPGGDSDAPQGEGRAQPASAAGCSTGLELVDSEMQRETLHRWSLRQLGAEVRLPESVLTRMCQLAEAAWPKETGGTLVGHYGAGGRVACIERAIGVREGARQGRSHFYRPPDTVDGQLAEIYRSSGGTCYYLGEWHSHPGSAPGPSATDLRTMRELAQSPHVATDTPILVIVEGSLQSPTVSCLVVDETGCVIDGIYLWPSVQLSTAQ